MIRALHVLALPLLLGVAIMLAIVATYWVLEVLLAGYADYDRGVWEGAVLVLVFNGGNTLANLVLKRVAARKKDEKDEELP